MHSCKIKPHHLWGAVISFQIQQNTGVTDATSHLWSMCWDKWKEKTKQKKPNPTKKYMSSLWRMKIKKKNNQRKANRENSKERTIFKQWVTGAIARTLHNDHFVNKWNWKCCPLAFQETSSKSGMWLKKRTAFFLQSNESFLSSEKYTCSAGFSACLMFCPCSVHARELSNAP